MITFVQNPYSFALLLFSLAPGLNRNRRCYGWHRLIPFQSKVIVGERKQVTHLLIDLHDGQWTGVRVSCVVT